MGRREGNKSVVRQQSLACAALGWNTSKCSKASDANSKLPDMLQSVVAWPCFELIGEVAHVQVKASNEPNLAVEAVLIHAKGASDARPTILMPHGGPHSCYPTSFFTGT